MKIALEARAITGASKGVKRYVTNLLEQLHSHPDIDLTVIYDKKGFTYLKNANEVHVKRRGDIGHNYWINHQIPRQIKQIKPDLVHFTKADTPNRKTIPTIVTIYDIIPLLFPASQKLPNKIYWQKALRRAVENSDQIITISEKSKQDIAQHLNVDKDKITVTKMAVDLQKFSFQPKKETAHPYIFYVGTVEPRKNIPGLIKAFDAVKNDIPHDLIIAGKNYKGTEQIKQLINEKGLDRRVQWKTDVSDEELVRLYQKASLLVWPSIYEGWGFPPQEAMACGTPVIVSDGGSLPEVVEDAGITVKFTATEIAKRTNDPEFISRLSQEIKRVLSDRELQQELIEKGRKQAQKNSWEQVANQTVSLYHELLNTP